MSAKRGTPQPFAVILGTNEIASAVAVYLRRAGYMVVMSHDPLPPVTCRGMAFHDALFHDEITLGGITARRIESGLEILATPNDASEVLVTELGLVDLLAVRPLAVLVDGRMQKYVTKPDLRMLARNTVGLGPGFTAGGNCDVAVETLPTKAGGIIDNGATDAADGVPRMVGGHGAERFVYSAEPGRWHTPLEIGTRIYKNLVVGYLGGNAIRAPFDGVLRGLVRDGTEVPAGVKLIEIDARSRRATWTGIEQRSRRIAEAVVTALSGRTAVAARRGIHLVK